MKNLERYLKNFPLRGNDDFEKLQSLVIERQQKCTLNPAEQSRLDYELSVIRETDTACVFLFFNELARELKEYGAVFHGGVHCSYLCYFLGLAKINPMQYGLPFERYFSVNRKNLPHGFLAVQKGAKGKAVQYLKWRLGADKIARLQDSLEEYVVSKNNVLDFSRIKQTILHTSPGEPVWHEDVVALTWRDVIGLGLYTISIREAEIPARSLSFSEADIYQRALEWFKEYREEDTGLRLGDRYVGNELAAAVFANTGGQYLYQEQFYEICTELLGVSNNKADEFHKALLLRRKDAIKEIKELFIRRMEEEGVALFEYIKDRHCYVVAKAHIIGLLFLGV